MKRFITTLHDMSQVPPGAIYRGRGRVDYELHAECPAIVIKDKLVEMNDGVEIFRKPGFTDRIKPRPKKPTIL